MFFKVVTTTAAAFLVAGSAFAADVVSYQDPTPVAPLAAAYDWSGFYVGINAGIGGGTAKHPFSIVDTAGTSLVDGSVNLNGNGFTGGVQAGYNVQSGALVWGVEGDIQYAHIDNRVSGSFGGGALDLEAGTRLNWFGTLRARVGTPVSDRFLAYVTGGAAYGETTSSVRAFSGGTTVFDQSARRGTWGWTVGAGGEYAITDKMTLKTEYLYTDLGKTNLISADLGGATANLDRDFNFHTVRVGLNFKF